MQILRPGNAPDTAAGSEAGETWRYLTLDGATAAFFYQYQGHPEISDGWHADINLGAKHGGLICTPEPTRAAIQGKIEWLMGEDGFEIIEDTARSNARGETLPTIWLTYDPEDGYEEHATEEEGRAALAGLLDQHRDWASDHVHDAVERVALYRCERVASIRQQVIASRDDDTHDGATCRARGWDFMVRLEIADD